MNIIIVVCFLLGNSPASEFYMLTFRNALSHLHRQGGVKNEVGLRNVGVFICKKVCLENSLSLLAQAKPQHFSNSVILHTYPPMMEQTECSETSAYKIQMPGNYPEESIQHSEHRGSLKSRKLLLFKNQYKAG
jgi:hypothetical protein